MSIPITSCDLRKALDKNNFTNLKKAMEFNINFGSFSIFPCRGHFFKKKCEFTEQEENIIFKKLAIYPCREDSKIMIIQRR